MQDIKMTEEAGSADAAAYEQPAESVDEIGNEGYDFSVIPNDFNVETLCNFMERGAIKVPIFQRDYVWKQREASRFIESVVWDYPVPEIFVYEMERNNWLVVDGHQRLLSLYYFWKGRFPLNRVKDAKLIPRLRRDEIFLDEETLGNDQLFSDFVLDVTPPYKGKPGVLHSKTYAQLSSSLREQVGRRPIRTVVIRQHGKERNPKARMGVIDIFERLNTGGKNLSAQQIRDCVFQSGLLRMVNTLNVDPSWRQMIGAPLVSQRRDAEHVLRALAMLVREDKYSLQDRKYSSSMNKFLDQFCAEMCEKQEKDEEIQYLREMFEGFMRACKGIEGVFVKDGRYFRSALFESVFVAALSKCYREKRKPQGKLQRKSITDLAGDKRFERVSGKAVMNKATVKERFKLAREFITPL